jgi:hypothetical protein
MNDFEKRAIAVLFNNGDESLLTESEVYDLYDMLTEFVRENYGDDSEDYHFSGSSLSHKTQTLH